MYKGRPCDVKANTKNNSWSRQELYNEAKSLGLKGISKKNKDQLFKLLISSNDIELPQVPINEIDEYSKNQQLDKINLIMDELEKIKFEYLNTVIDGKVIHIQVK